MGIQPRTRSARILLILFLVSLECLTSVGAANLIQCGERLRDAQQGALNATNSTSPPPLLHLSYAECVAECGGGTGDVNWSQFSQSFGAWFLPWVALMFQIPFGAESPLEDVLNFCMTIGSPALAAYSLQITHLNARWLGKAFKDLEYPNSGAISTVVSAFQHVPIRISSNPAGLLPSLIILPQNDDYWELLLKGVEKTRRWSIPLVMNFVWVVFAVLLTIIDSFHLSQPSNDVGYAIVAAWTYLLPLIMGWLHVGSQPEPNHLRDCLDAANRIAWVAQGDRPVLVRELGGQSTQAIEFIKGDVDAARRDELRTSPVFNYSRAFTWSVKAEHILSLTKNAATKADGRGAVRVAGGSGDVAGEKRLWTDEQVIKHCTDNTTPFETVFGAPSPVLPPSPVSSRTPSTTIALLPFYDPRGIRRHSRWASGIWGRVGFALLFALGLQWGTIGAAVTIHYWKAPIGLGCRAMAFLLYGVLATLVLFLALTSSILAHISRPQHGPIYWHSWSQTFLNGGAVFCGHLSKALAFASGIATFDRGFHDVVLLTINYTVGPGLIHVWIGGLVLAFSTAVLFGISVYLGTPPRK